jgi:uncharacterized coiled-coil protein SlyX
MADPEQLAEHLIDLEVKLAYQDRLIKDLDELVRQFGTRLDTMGRELETLKQSLQSPEVSMGPANDKPPHY